MFRSLVANAYLENKITGAILSEEEIADQASPALADVRRKIRAASGKAREVLQRLISSSSAKYLQEPIVTIRSGRFVVPVKAECRGSVPGLVHDVSASGSTFFVEPMAAVKANNELRELQAREEKEIERILAALSAEAAGFREDILLDCDLLVALDLIFARGRLSVQMEAIEPQLTADGSLRFLAARHPLLDRKKAVPIDLNLGITFDTLVITGPTYRRKDGHPQDGGAAVPDGPVRTPPAGGRRQPLPGLPRESWPTSATSSPLSSRCPPFQPTSPTSSASLSEAGGGQPDPARRTGRGHRPD